jgi:ubiquinone/menaquinone biosynthesis C-methylase UbiE
MTLPSYAMDQASFPEMYERWLVGPLFRPWVEPTLAVLHVSPGDRVLDIACGTGIVARVARERLQASVVGVDVSSDMLAVARRIAPEIDWRQGDAAKLPLGDGEQFDIVVCQQGLQFFPDKPAAAGEMRRALASDGRLAVATWPTDDELPLFRELRRVAERHVGAVADQRYGYGDAGAVEALLRGAGFRDVRSSTLSRSIRFEDAGPFLRLNAMALVRMSAGGRAMADADRGRTVDLIVEESAPVAEPHAEGAGLAFELSTNLVTARG